MKATMGKAITLTHPLPPRIISTLHLLTEKASEKKSELIREIGGKKDEVIRR